MTSNFSSLSNKESRSSVILKAQIIIPLSPCLTTDSSCFVQMQVCKLYTQMTLFREKCNFLCNVSNKTDLCSLSLIVQSLTQKNLIPGESIQNVFFPLKFPSFWSSDLVLWKLAIVVNVFHLNIISSPCEKMGFKLFGTSLVALFQIDVQQSVLKMIMFSSLTHT